MTLKRISHIFCLLCMVPFISSCGIPVPADKIDYVGEWKSKAMYLLILEDGSVQYKRLKGGATTEISGPIKEFQGDNFIVGVGFIKTTFEVSKPPYQEAGVWKMVVDGVELQRPIQNR